MPSLDMDTGRSYAAPFSAIAHVLSFTRKIRRLKSLGVFHENKRADFFQLANLDKMRFLAVLLGRQSNLFKDSQFRSTVQRRLTPLFFTEWLSVLVGLHPTA
jgi:hypothetical protein